jgi:hypothetical protein
MREKRERERENCIGFLIQSISFSDDRSFKGLESIRSLTFYLSFLYNYVIKQIYIHITGETSERGDVTTHRRILSRRGVREHF